MEVGRTRRHVINRSVDTSVEVMPDGCRRSLQPLMSDSELQDALWGFPSDGLDEPVTAGSPKRTPEGRRQRHARLLAVEGCLRRDGRRCGLTPTSDALEDLILIEGAALEGEHPQDPGGRVELLGEAR